VDSSHELVEAFAEAVPAALREWAGVEAIVRESGPASAVDPGAGLIAGIGLTMVSGEGRLELFVPERTAAELARRVLTGAVDPVAEDLVRDCMGEVANVVAGHAKALLVGRPSHFTLSTPVVRSGGLIEGTGGWVIRFESDAGTFGAHVRPPA
jgi:CheY-specific phosphatase CheX